MNKTLEEMALAVNQMQDDIFKKFESTLATDALAMDEIERANSNKQLQYLHDTGFSIPISKFTLQNFGGKLVPIQKKEKFGCVDRQGHIVIDVCYDDVSIYSGIESFIVVKNYINDSKSRYRVGLLDCKGKTILPMEYIAISIEFGGNRIRVRNAESDKTALLDLKGNFIIPYSAYTLWWSSFKGFMKVSKNKRYGLIDSSGNEVLPCVYTDMWGDSEFSEYLFVKQNGKTTKIKISELQ